MPKQFKFFINNQLNFQCRLQSEQCTAIKPNGLQCRNRTVIGTNICWTHLLHRDHLRILDTPHGKGLFAKNPRKAPNAVIFSRAQRIISYGGQIIDLWDLNRRYGKKTAPYGVDIGNNEYEDGACLRGIGSIANHASGDRANARFGFTRGGELFLYADKPIRNGQEILIDYNRGGREMGDNRRQYRLHEKAVRHETVNVA